MSPFDLGSLQHGQLMRTAALDLSLGWQAYILKECLSRGEYVYELDANGQDRLKDKPAIKRGRA
jgi:hypothetical protein